MIGIFRTSCALSFFVVLSLAVSAQSQTLRRIAGFNLDWKFTQGNPANAQMPAFNDGAWAAVNIPHSASYDPPTVSGDTGHYKGDCWYRKTFFCPANAKRVFLQFDAAMQTATMYLNGTPVGIHDNSGYTGFCFEISGQLKRDSSNCVAVKLNNVRSLDIPPGGIGSRPDYCLFSGMYRDVWLLFKDSVYVPYCGQRISTPAVSTTSATVRARTTVVNSSTTAKTCQVTVTIRDSNDIAVVSQTGQQSIAANATFEFDMTTGAIANPRLWSPTTPYMYSVMTLVRVGGVVVDSIVEPCGFRTFAWSPTQGFLLNGTRLQIRGVCASQFMGWIENAVPDSRFAKEVQKIREMGANSIRCAHYPRSPAFYDACDRLGMLVYVEVPTWGYESPAVMPPAAFWTRLNNCTREMIQVAVNHPCIYAWGLYNEAQLDFTAGIRPMIATAKSLDSMRVVTLANNAILPQTTLTDIVGLNYMNVYGNNSFAVLNTEYHGNWGFEEIRGSQADLDTVHAHEAWNDWVSVVNAGPRLAGGHLWCYRDYFSSWWKTHMGVVDHLNIPKNSYFLFRRNWTGAAPDFPVSGTAAKIDLVADLTALKADGSDICQLVATLRNAAGACINQPCTITFSVSAPASATIFGTPGVATAGGRAGAILRRTRTPGQITVIATASCAVTPDTVFLTSSPVVESYYDITSGISPAPRPPVNSAAARLAVTPVAGGFAVMVPAGRDGMLKVFNSQGRVLALFAAKAGSAMIVKRESLGSGIACLAWDNGRQRIVKRLCFVNGTGTVAGK